MDIPLCLTLSFNHHEWLVLVENGGASPCEVEESLGMERPETRAVLRDRVRRGLLDWPGRSHAQRALT